MWCTTYQVCGYTSLKYTYNNQKKKEEKKRNFVENRAHLYTYTHACYIRFGSDGLITIYAYIIQQCWETFIHI